jgi:hypothetical protein
LGHNPEFKIIFFILHIEYTNETLVIKNETKFVKGNNNNNNNNTNQIFVKPQDGLVSLGMSGSKSLDMNHGSSQFQIRKKTNDCNYVYTYRVLFNNYGFYCCQSTQFCLDGNNKQI